MGKPKILVERTQENQHVIKKQYPIEDGKVIINRGGFGAKDYKYCPPFRPDRVVDEDFSYGRFAFIWNFLFGVHRKVYYIDGSDELTPVIPGGEPPKYTVREYVKAADAKLLEKQAKTTTQTTTMGLITLIAAVLIIFMNWVIWTKLGIVNV